MSVGRTPRTSAPPGALPGRLPNSPFTYHATCGTERAPGAQGHTGRRLPRQPLPQKLTVQAVKCRVTWGRCGGWSGAPPASGCPGGLFRTGWRAPDPPVPLGLTEFPSRWGLSVCVSDRQLLGQADATVGESVLGTLSFSCRAVC